MVMIFSVIHSYTVPSGMASVVLSWCFILRIVAVGVEVEVICG